MQPTFSNENEFKKDFQMTLDENLINHLLMGLFYSKHTYSFTEFLLEMTPGSIKQISQMATNFFTSSIFAPLFPNMQRDIGLGKRIDFRCGFNKQFMNGKVEDDHISQIWFKQGNIIEFNFNFGCSVVYNKKQGPTTPLSIFQAFDQDSADWAPWRSFFFSLKGDVQLDFKNNEKVNGILTGKIDTLNLRENHIKVFRGDTEVPKEELEYVNSFNEFANTL